VKVCLGTHHLWHRWESEPALSLHVLPRVESLAVAIGQRVVGQWSQTFDRLPFERTRRKTVQGHPGGPWHLRAWMPTCAVEPQAAWPPAPPSGGNLCSRHRARGTRYGGQQPPHSPARGGWDEGIEVTPWVTVLDDRFRPLPPAAPYPPPDRRAAQALGHRLTPLRIHRSPASRRHFGAGPAPPSGGG
jgi:hypothetical protein